jgi:hypothetical protein
MFIGADNAQLWRSLLSVPFACNKGRNSIDVTYAVGQPMGAYSSWAMLALTHHLIVLMSSPRPKLNSNSKPFDSYAVLGDDVVIQNSKVARNYLDLMNYLGVEISLPKSMISFNHLEFAKKIFTKEGDIVSMVSPGLMLAVIRNNFLQGLLIAELLLRKVFTVDNLGKILISFPFNKANEIAFALWSLIGLRGLVTSDQQIAQQWGMSWLHSVTDFPDTADNMKYTTYFTYPLVQAVYKQFTQKVLLAQKTNMAALKGWYKWLSPLEYNFFSIGTLKLVSSWRHKSLIGYAIILMSIVANLLATVMVLFSPVPWLLLDDILLSLGDRPQDKISQNLNTYENAMQIAAEIKELQVHLVGDLIIKQDLSDFTRSYEKLVDDYRAIQMDVTVAMMTHYEYFIPLVSEDSTYSEKV